MKETELDYFHIAVWVMTLCCSLEEHTAQSAGDHSPIRDTVPRILIGWKCQPSELGTVTPMGGMLPSIQAYFCPEYGGNMVLQHLGTHLLD